LSHEKVNCITVLGQPDLVVSGLTHTPEAPPLGGPVTFDVTIANQGTAQAGPFTVSLQGAATSVRAMISSLGAGSSTTLQLVLPLSKRGETFRVKADSNWRVVESDESNNTAQRMVSDSLR
jgi:subtilase family serine protease